MSPVLVDSNVLVDVLTADARWYHWSAATLGQLADREVLVINPIVYAEIASGFATVEELNAALPADLRREELPYAAGFLAGHAFRRYRLSGGGRRSPLPDFYIGAHAAVSGYRLMTRDVSRYRTYFPRLDLIAPAGS